MRNYKSSSTVKPLEWDLTSSKKKVYHNYNITQEFAEEGPIMYYYNVDEYERMEYLEYKNTVQDNALADTDGMLVDMMYNITLLELGL